MIAISRELVYQTLEFDGPKRAPRQLWVLPWAQINYPTELNKIVSDFPDDIVNAPANYSTAPPTSGNRYEIGEYVDPWGCVFENRQRGIIGEVKKPIVGDEDWGDVGRVHVPREWLSFDSEAVNDFCRQSDQFVIAGACPRPFEQLQFIRGSENLYVDLMLRPDRMISFLGEMHAFYCELLEKWAQTDVDSLTFMDDWGSQQTLLIDPAMWREVSKPLYAEYISIAHANDKKIFMHSDGHITAIIPDLIELGVDAVNSQLFCMGLDSLSQYAGKITFWGEIDRQHLLPDGTVADIRSAVSRVKESLWQSGGCIAQCEFGPGAKPENVAAVFETWARIV